MPKHGHNKISAIVCLCSLKIIDKGFFSFIFLTIVGPSSWEKPSLSVQLLIRFIYAAAKVNAIWFIRLIYWPTRRKNSILFVQRKTTFTRKCRERKWPQWSRRLLGRYEQKVRQAESAVTKGLTKEANRFAYVDSSHELNRIKFVYSDSEKCFGISNVRELSGVRFSL